jgi:hypothetical protein
MQINGHGDLVAVLEAEIALGEAAVSAASAD